MIGKFGRIYRLDVFTPAGKQITIKPPFSIQFQITRNTLASANKMNITLYNLGPNTRNQIFRDRYNIAERWPISLYAGYGNRLHEVFVGKIFEAMSFKKGTEWITTIDAFDGLDEAQNGFISETIAAQVSFEEVITRIVATMPDLILGFLGAPAEGTAPRGSSYIGSSMNAIGDITGGQHFIDKQTLNVLADDEVLPGDVTFLDPSLLLSTPRRREAFLDIATLFEPIVDLGRVYAIESVDPRYNGQYKVVGFSHNVTISSAAAGDARSNISLDFFRGFPAVHNPSRVHNV